MGEMLDRPWQRHELWRFGKEGVGDQGACGLQYESPRGKGLPGGIYPVSFTVAECTAVLIEKYGEADLRPKYGRIGRCTETSFWITGRAQLNCDPIYGMCRSNDTVGKPGDTDSLISGCRCEVNGVSIVAHVCC